MVQKQLFRKVSLARLSSPEQLDMLVRVTTPTGWYALLTLGMLLGMALMWGFVGNIPVKVKGQGIFMRHGGIQSVVTLGEGQISEVVVEPGDIVRHGQIVARLSQPLLQAELRNARSEQEEAKIQHAQLQKFSNEDIGYQLERLSAQRKSIGFSVESLEKQVEFYRGQLFKQKGLLEKGLIIPVKVEGTRKNLNLTLEQIDGLRIKLEDITIQRYTLENRHRQLIHKSEENLSLCARKVSLLEKRLAFESRVVSKISGRVIEVLVSAGQVINAGDPVVNMEFMDKTLQAILFVPSADGKKIKSGMEIDLVPSTVKKEEHGSLLGLVTYVSEYPATYRGMVHMLGNEQLVQTLSESGAPMVVYADMIPDSKTVSGYKWSSGKGPDTTIQGGTLCLGEIIVENRLPISFVIPYLKQTLGI